MNGCLVCFGILLAYASTLFVATTHCAVAADQQAKEWPNWRGPQQNRTSTEKNLIESWDPAQGYWGGGTG